MTIQNIIAEGDKVVVRNTWRATESVNRRGIEFDDIVIWRIARGQLVERRLVSSSPPGGLSRSLPAGKVRPISDGFRGNNACGFGFIA